MIIFILIIFEIITRLAIILNTYQLKESRILRCLDNEYVWHRNAIFFEILTKP